MSPSRRVVAAAALLFLLGPGLAQGQVVERAFDVDVGGGVILHQNASALVPLSPALNLRARYFVTSNVGIGFSLDYSRTETDDDIFPLGQFAFTTADSTLLVAMTQPLAIFHYELIGTLGKEVGRLYPQLVLGLGGYTIYMDPQQNAGNSRMSDFSFSVGGAVKWALSETAGLELSLRDVVFTGYDRERLNLIPDRTCRVRDETQFSGTVCPNERYPFLDPEHSDPNWVGPSSTVHNFIVTLAFSLFPE